MSRSDEGRTETDWRDLLRMVLLATLASAVFGLSIGAIYTSPLAEAEVGAMVVVLALYFLGLAPSLLASFLWLDSVRVGHSSMRKATLVGGGLLAASIATGPWLVYGALSVPVVMLAIWAAVTRGAKPLGILGPMALTVGALFIAWPVTQIAGEFADYPEQVFVAGFFMSVLFMLPNAVAVFFGSDPKRSHPDHAIQ